jgi:flavin reductase (DIM6/NTAB) family NADH-FMN oxidoreductase RutF/uncharacterized protein YciI
MRATQPQAGSGPRPPRAAKVAFPVDKADWHPSVLPGPIVLVSTVDDRGQPNIAPKSFISMMAFGGPVLAFGCHRSHATARNAETAGQFVVNFPPESLAERIWAMPASHGPERITRSGLSLLPARQVAPPLIAECKAHLECTLASVTRLGSEVVVFGTIVAAAIDQDCLGSTLAEQYFRLRPVFFLEEGVYGSIETAKRAGAAWPADQPLTVVELYDPPAGTDMEAHLAFLRSLRGAGVLVMAGPYDCAHQEPDGPCPSGMVVLAVPEDQARQIAAADPLVRSGARYVTRRWRRTF